MKKLVMFAHTEKEKSEVTLGCIDPLGILR